MNNNRRKTALQIIWWIYIVLLLTIVIIKFRGSFAELSEKIATTPYSTNYNLVPFSMMKMYYSNLSEGWVKLNIIGNVLPFMPFGFLLPSAYPKTDSLKHILVIGFFSILFFETLQFVTRLGSFDVDDIILNMLGIICGYLILKLSRRIAGKNR